MAPILEATELSLWVALGCTLVTVPSGLVAATLLFRSRWRWLEVFFLLPLFLPPTVTGFVLLWVLSPLRWPGSWLGEWGWQVVFTSYGTLLACAVVSFPLAFQACMVGLSRIHPELMEGGLTLGGTRLFNVVRVVWPQMKAAIVVACLLVFARALGEFGASIMLGGNLAGETQTLPLAVYSFALAGEFGAAGVATLVSAALGLLVYFLLRVLEKGSDGSP
jgi:molybdate transport system permease protein